MAALYPPLVVKVADVDPVTLEAFLLVLGVLFVARALADGEPSYVGSLGEVGQGTGERGCSGCQPAVHRVVGSAAAAGAALGLVVLARPALLLFVGLLIAGLAYRRHRRWAGVAMLGAFLLCLAPWAARNWAIHHQFVLISTNGGFNFWIGNNPLATGEA